MKTIRQLKEEITEVWEKVCNSEESLEFNDRQEGFIKTRELQAQLQTLKNVIKIIEDGEWICWNDNLLWEQDKSLRELKKELTSNNGDTNK